ncbi:MAG: 3-deoxy-manno-octulosonate cytidylyltransferase [Gammaproteobacteria bacterium]|nr:3-deoxy-manno-octulosonate cytidylyltransferase [Gammaproteobacteria bacterium]HBF08514.1 3-deoxy-manno-octulosonate cytidylyltransferase [Gammaproteobacteria bacterium]|tara:strand:- start:92 stop:940 length:849 start_codon:yes stop_codon:yes gene_type:complete
MTTTNKKHSIAIIIPARYHSTRLPGKPLALIAGTPMIERVWAIAQHVCDKYADNTAVEVSAYVTSEDERIINHCSQQKIPAILTSDECRSGTARVAEAASKLESKPDFVVNLQGDNALCPPWFIQSIIDNYINHPISGVITPFVKLSWKELDQLRKEKQQTPFSGTCVVFNTNQEAFWFSKNIIPAIRKEEKLREASEQSPITRHIGLYGYDLKTLEQILTLDETDYEALEGLEQLSFLEAGIRIQMTEVDYRGRQGMTGIDSPDDVGRAEQIIAKDGEFFS